MNSLIHTINKDKRTDGQDRQLRAATRIVCWILTGWLVADFYQTKLALHSVLINRAAAAIIRFRNISILFQSKY